MHIDSQNIIPLIFMDQVLHKRLPHHKQLFDRWMQGFMAPSLRTQSQKASLELLELLEFDLTILEEYFNEKVTIQPIDYHIVRHHTVTLDGVETTLNGLTGFTDNFSISRDADNVQISFWR